MGFWSAGSLCPSWAIRCVSVLTFPSGLGQSDESGTCRSELVGLFSVLCIGQARGEILRPRLDERRRRRSAGGLPSIKNESVGIEDYQIPS